MPRAHKLFIGFVLGRPLSWSSFRCWSTFFFFFHRGKLARGRWRSLIESGGPKKITGKRRIVARVSSVRGSKPNGLKRAGECNSSSKNWRVKGSHYFARWCWGVFSPFWGGYFCLVVFYLRWNFLWETVYWSYAWNPLEFRGFKDSRRQK